MGLRLLHLAARLARDPRGASRVRDAGTSFGDRGGGARRGGGPTSERSTGDARRALALGAAPLKVPGRFTGRDRSPIAARDLTPQDGLVAPRPSAIASQPGLP